MRDTIEQVLNGNFAEGGAILNFSCTRIEIAFHKGTQYRGEFTLSLANKRIPSGILYASDPRFECLTTTFEGEEVTVPFLFHGENMAEGEVAKGAIAIVSNCGEWSIPFEAMVESRQLESSIGPVKNLFHFANLAKTNWQEALKLFYSPAFRSIFVGNDRKYLEDYLSLACYNLQEQNMEEFLIHINKKQKVVYFAEPASFEKDLLYIPDSTKMLDGEVVVTKNGWGYTQLKVETEGDFLLVPKASLSDDDFIGNHCALQFYIDQSLCRVGKNMGKIRLYNSYITLEIPVQITVGERSVLSRSQLERKKNLAQVYSIYRDFRLKKINVSGWIKESSRVVDNMIAADEFDISARLYKAQILITQERFNEAEWILKHVANLLEKERTETETVTALKVYYLYLTTLIKRDAQYVDEITTRVQRVYKQNRNSWQIAWLLLFLCPEYQDNGIGKWHFLEEQYENGCRSFAIYIEALQVLNQNPAMLRKLDEFELQTLSYGVRNHYVSRDLAEQVIYLAGKNPQYHPILEHILAYIYNEKKDEKVLQIICTMLIAGSKTDTRYFKWYELAVKNKLRITNLYEFFILSMPLDGSISIPKIVLLYFSYQNNLDYKHTAFLYHYIVENKQELGEIYSNFYPKMKQFALEQMGRIRIGEDLAYLYETVLEEADFTEETCNIMASLLYAKELTVKTPDIAKVIVYQPGCRKHEEYLLSDKTATIFLYDRESVLVFEDTEHNRFLSTVEYRLKNLFASSKHTRMVEARGKHPYLDIARVHEMRVGDLLSDELAERAMRAIDYESTDRELKLELGMMLLDYFYEKDRMNELDNVLEWIDAGKLSAKDRATVMKYQVLRGFYDKAFLMVKTYGPDFADISTLLRMLGALLPKQEDENRKETLLFACEYALDKRKYNGVVLDYLCRAYQGSTKKMREIYNACREYGQDPYELAERMLVQSLYSGVYLPDKSEIFKYYASKGGNELVELAYITQTAYDYLVKEQLVDDVTFQELYRMYRNGADIPLICKAAYIKYYAEEPSNDLHDQMDACKDFLKTLLKERVLLPSFQKLFGKQLQEEMEDRTIIEYRTGSGIRAKIHYMIAEGEATDGNYRSEYMREIFPGLYVKEFVLFFGENLQYYIMEETDSEPVLSESGTIRKNDISMDGYTSRYDLINDMLISGSLQDYDTMDKSLEDYMKKDYYNNSLFTLK